MSQFGFQPNLFRRLGSSENIDPKKIRAEKVSKGPDGRLYRHLKVDSGFLTSLIPSKVKANPRIGSLLAKRITVATNSVEIAAQRGIIPQTPGQWGKQWGRLTYGLVDKLSWTPLKEQVEALSTAQLSELITERRQEISHKKETFRPLVEEVESQRHPDIHKELSLLESEGSFDRDTGGEGGAYFLKNSAGEIRYVVKPVDEDVLCLNNRKEWASPFNDEGHRVRPDIPLYRSAQTEVLASIIAEMTGLETVVPPTVMTIMESDAFHDIMDVFPSDLLDLTEEVDKEKLCSVQCFIPGTQELSQVTEGKDPQDYPELIDHEDFEDANILTWIINEQDGHLGNYLAYPKGDVDGQTRYGLYKIDNAFSFGEKEGYYKNSLEVFEQAKRPLSERAREKINNLPIERMVGKMQQYGLSEGSIQSFRDRITALQSWITDPSITIEAINENMLKLPFMEG
ncbi:MAG: hypothetical protein ACQEP8_05400 [Chlamydiota bacterium]